MRTTQVFIVGLILVLVSGCSTSATSPPEDGIPSTTSVTPKVIVQGGTEGKEILQTIDLDNCDGKSDAVRSEEWTMSVDVTVSAEIAASAGVSAEVVSAEVQAAVGAALSQGSSKSMAIQLTAPPGTHMNFQIVWVGDEQVGIVQDVAGLDIPIAFRSFVPYDVRVKSQFDVGCPGQSAFQGVAPSSTDTSPTPQPITNSRVRWVQEVSQIPESGTQLTWDLSGGQILLLGGGQFQIGDVFCGGDAQRICILIYQASTRQTVTINALVPRQNYVSVTESLSADEALEDKEPLFWIPPNCVSGCQRATVLFFEDGALVNKVNLTAP